MEADGDDSALRIGRRPILMTLPAPVSESASLLVAEDSCSVPDDCSWFCGTGVLLKAAAPVVVSTLSCLEDEVGRTGSGLNFTGAGISAVCSNGPLRNCL